MIILYSLAAVGIIAILIVAWMMLEDTINDIRESKLRKKERSSAIKIANRIKSMHYWFSTMPQAFNVLFLTQYYIREYGYVNAERIREKVRELGDNRYCDLSKEKLNDLLKG